MPKIPTNVFLEQARSQKRLSPSQLAKKAHISVTTVTGNESRTQAPSRASANTYRGFADALGLNLLRLMEAIRTWEVEPDDVKIRPGESNWPDI